MKGDSRTKADPLCLTGLIQGQREREEEKGRKRKKEIREQKWKRKQTNKLRGP
jgi:hypothetical protein